MKTTKEILDAARQRAPGQPYAGAVTPGRSLRAAAGGPERETGRRAHQRRARLGRPRRGRRDGQQLAVEWASYPGGQPNPQFGAQLEQAAGKDDILLFLCRSGVRSRHSARVATELGYANAFDILEGFEGDKDGEGHRKTVGGWCKAGLPWIGA